MESDEVRAFWEANAEAWIRLSRAGYDVYRDRVNSPAFFKMLPDVRGKAGVDIGCGEGHNTRQVAYLGARVLGVDISQTFIDAAIEVERIEPRGIRYRLGDAEALPLHDASFDFATALMSLMDVAHPERAIREAARVIKPGGFLQFSITHPCFQANGMRLTKNEDGEVSSVAWPGYFEHADGRIEEWSFGTAPAEIREKERRFRIPTFSRTLGEWVGAIADAGLLVERIEEPRADEQAVKDHPKLAAARAVPFFLIVRAIKPR